MKKYVVIAFFVSVFSFLACAGGASKPSNPSKAGSSATTVYYFHGAQRCPTCLAIESETRKVLDTKFQQQMKEGKIVLKIVDLSKKENEKLAEKYEVAWSSLIIDNGKTIVNLTGDAFSYARNEPQVFEKKLTETLHKMLQ